MMTQKTSFRLFTLIIIFSLACSFATGLAGGGDGPANFTASLTAPDVVLLTWDAVEGATGYVLELSIDKGESVQIVALPPERTSYEDLSAPEKSDLTYQVQAVTDSGPAGKSQVGIATSAREPNPYTVKPSYDEENATTTVVGTQGGTASLIDSNGVEYTLSIPEGALSADTEIRMTPVTAIQDWPLDGASIGAVRLEPEGLLLNDVAILTIGIPVDLDADLAIAGFAFDADGLEFHLQMSEPENGLTEYLPSEGGHLARPLIQQPKHVVRMPVVELRVAGVGQTSGDKAAELVKNIPPTDPGAALAAKWAAEDIVDQELTPLENVKGVKDPARAQAFELIKGFYNAENCTDLNSQIASFQIWMNTRAYVGLNDDQRRDYTRQIWEELADKVKEVLEKAATDCEKSSETGGSPAADSPCAKALLGKISTPLQTRSGFWDALKDKMADKLSDTELQDIKDALEKCKPAAYQIVGGSGDFQTNTSVCNIMKPFTLTGGGFIVNFSGGLSGTYTYTGPFGGQGGQSYGILLPDGFGKPGTMTGGGTGCVETPRGTKCKNATEEYDLSPLEPGARCTQ